MEPLLSSSDPAFWNILEQSQTFWNILHVFACILYSFLNILHAFWNILEHSKTFYIHSVTFLNILHTFWNILEHSGTFWNILEHSVSCIFKLGLTHPNIRTWWAVLKILYSSCPNLTLLTLTWPIPNLDLDLSLTICHFRRTKLWTKLWTKFCQTSSTAYKELHGVWSKHKKWAVYYLLYMF